MKILGGKIIQFSFFNLIFAICNESERNLGSLLGGWIDNQFEDHPARFVRIQIGKTASIFPLKMLCDLESLAFGKVHRPLEIRHSKPDMVDPFAFLSEKRFMNRLPVHEFDEFDLNRAQVKKGPFASIPACFPIVTRRWVFDLPDFKRPHPEFFPVILQGFIDALDNNPYLAKLRGVKNFFLRGTHPLSFP